jgi:glycosyltransferase involved in cell wall biosynthesis
LTEEIIASEKNPVRLGNILVELHKYLKEYDYKNSFKSKMAWNVFKGTVLNYTSESSNRMAQPSVFDLIQSLGWIYRFLIILNTPLPRVDVTHSAAAAFCGIPCVLAKLENKTPFLLTEHGVYMREQYLSLSRRGYSSYLSTFLVRMIHSVAGLNYAMADQVSPVCVYNTRWEKVFGVSPNAIDVIYNGVDRDVFAPQPDFQKNPHPTVVCVARVDPVKDLVTLIRAAAIVKEKIPDVRFLVFGSVTVPGYYEECLAVKRELNLDETFIFAGHSNDIPSAYRSGDVVALSSITEAFPYSVVEAMMTGKPVVATDVGGVKEAVGDCGLVVRPRRPEEFARALITLLLDPELRASLGREARERALNYFTIERALELYLNSYRKLALKAVEVKVAPISLKRQKLLAEKGYALAESGYWREAIQHFHLAVEAAVDSPAVPVLLFEIATAYNNLGKFDLAFNELEKAEAMAQLIESARAA